MVEGGESLGKPTSAKRQSATLRYEGDDHRHLVDALYQRLRLGTGLTRTVSAILCARMIPRLFLAAIFLGVAGLVATPPRSKWRIGDSITEGAGLSNPSLESYPAKLHRLLGPGYEARNYGVSGRTLLKKGDFPYWNENAYRQSREWNPDIVVIQLGTNDSKPQNWRHSTNFYSRLRIVDRQLHEPGEPSRVMLAHPVRFMPTERLTSGLEWCGPIRPAVRDLAARFGLRGDRSSDLLAGHSSGFRHGSSECARNDRDDVCHSHCHRRNTNNAGHD